MSRTGKNEGRRLRPVRPVPRAGPLTTAGGRDKKQEAGQTMCLPGPKSKKATLPLGQCRRHSPLFSCFRVKRRFMVPRGKGTLPAERHRGKAVQSAKTRSVLCRSAGPQVAKSATKAGVTCVASRSCFFEAQRPERADAAMNARGPPGVFRAGLFFVCLSCLLSYLILRRGFRRCGACAEPRHRRGAAVPCPQARVCPVRELRRYRERR